MERKGGIVEQAKLLKGGKPWWGWGEGSRLEGEVLKCRWMVFMLVVFIFISPFVFSFP